MALNLASLPQANGGWFKPKDNVDAVAILVEVKAYDRQRPTPNGPKDSALCDISVWKSREQLGGAPEVNCGQRIEQTVLARDLETVVGQAVLVTVDQVPSKKPGGNPAWIWKPVTDPEIISAVVAYGEKRDAAVSAAAAEAPDFD
ncbi:hypothetical protein [Streptomyces venezuelae]|uniref:hypothetical protein n=1 Tax=Streptomyces venezuelae TaxID=54571 RepID=UPI0037A77F81